MSETRPDGRYTLRRRGSIMQLSFAIKKCEGATNMERCNHVTATKNDYSRDLYFLLMVVSCRLKLREGLDSLLQESFVVVGKFIPNSSASVRASSYRRFDSKRSALHILVPVI